DRNARARPVAGAVAEGQFRPRALQQRLGDEEAEAEPAGPLILLPPGDIRIADTLEDIGRIAVAVVLDDDAHAFRRVADDDGHLLAGMVDGVFQQIAEAVENAGIAVADRLVLALAVFHEIEADAEFAVR